MSLSKAERELFWPALPFGEWQGTAETLQLWTQIIGKIRLALTPWVNHSKMGSRSVKQGVAASAVSGARQRQLGRRQLRWDWRGLNFGLVLRAHWNDGRTGSGDGR